MSTEISQNEKQREKRKKVKQILKNCGTITKGLTYAKWEHQKEKNKRNRKNN